MRSKSIRETNIYSESWNLAWREKGTGSIIEDKVTPFNIIKNPYRYWVADPFLFEYQQETYIFAELFDYCLRRGVLGCCKFNGTDKVKWKPIISEPFHLSYPCIFEYKGNIYIMPESGADKSLLLYIAVEFPYKWKKCNIIRENVDFADVTPIVGCSDKLAVAHMVEDHYSPKLIIVCLEGKKPDRIISDAIPFESRPAGYNFMYNNINVRPVQKSLDCDKGYGKSLIFCKFNIDENLSYTEEKIDEISPQDLKYNSKFYITGMHTYNSTDKYEIIDIKTKRFNFLDFITRLFGKLKNYVKDYLFKKRKSH